jgi:hypothetical protein
MNKMPNAPAENFVPTETWNVDDAPDADIAQVIQEMNGENPKKLIDGLTQKVEQADNGVRIAVLNGGGSEASEYSTTDALVMFNPYANGLTPNMLVRGEFVRRAAKKKDVRDDEGKLKPVLAVASPGIKGSNPKLTDAEMQKIRMGNLGPVAREMLRAVTERDFGRAALFGFSQGADMALTGAYETYGSNLDATALAIGDPAGVEDRLVMNLGTDFMKAPDIKPSIKRTGLDAQQKALGNGIAGMAEFAASALHPLNRALIRGMGKNNFEWMAESALDDGVVDKLVVGYGEESAIAKPGEIEPVLAGLHDRDTGTLISVKVGGANHTWGDQLPLLTKLYMRAVEA